MNIISNVANSSKQKKCFSDLTNFLVIPITENTIQNYYSIFNFGYDQFFYYHIDCVLSLIN